MNLDVLYLRLLSLTAFRALLEDPVVEAAAALLKHLRQKEGVEALETWALLVSRLEGSGFSGLGELLWDRLCTSDAPWPRSVAEGREDPALSNHAQRDVETLNALGRLDPAALRQNLSQLLPGQAAETLPGWDMGRELTIQALRQQYRDHGTGLFARFRAFLWDDGRLLPVEKPDAPHETDLIGYRRQRGQVEANTRVLLSGWRANNVLLFGESGTGKSATVKSLLNLPNTAELRLIEIEKDSIHLLPQLIRSLAGRRQKFILFIDDLAFDQDDRTYGVLKTILEGGLEPRPDNVAIYATSNRRNLVRQTFSDRAGDEVDRGETIQEKTALADRFGLRIPYLGLAKAEYLELVEHLAEQAGLDVDREDLSRQAMTWDARHPGRSPRTARQFIDSLM